MPWKRILALLFGKRRSEEELPWLATERTQVNETASGGSPIQIVVGLDFGTSFTKVVVGESRIRYAVPFGEFSLRTNPYLLPSAVSILEVDGKCTLGVCENATQVFDDLKMPLIDRDFGEQVQLRAIAFLALVFRYARGWFFSTHGHTYKNRQIQWFVNIGIPTDSFDDEDLTRVFLNITRAAWHSSTVQGPISLARYADKLGAGNEQIRRSTERYSDRLLPDDRFHAFPEFAAQLTGYTRSPRHQKDLHAMIDIGGGTVDVTIFNVVQRQGEDRFPIFARTVQPLGPRYLVRHRFSKFGIHDSREISPFEDLPPDEEFADLCRTSVLRLAEIDNLFQRKIRKCIGGPLLFTKQCRHPNSKHWKSGLPTFFCGGAISSEFYMKLLERFTEHDHPLRLVSTELPEPEDFEADLREGAPYNRLALAYGLSFDPFDIGQIIRMNDIDDMEPDPIVDFTDRYISKDMM